MEPLGRGAVGRVFKVEHEITRRVEAMKVLLSGRADQQDLAQRFLREIQVQASLDHPNIAAVLNAMWADDDLVMVMELVEGEPLSQKLERGRLPLEEALDYAKQTLAALDYAHSRGVIHRDISTANIIVAPDGAVKLADFGLARMENDPRMTQTGVAVGSLHYMSPEQVRAREQPDARSDIYSIGAVLYEMATGRKAFEGDTAFVLMVAQVQESPKPPVEVDAAIPRPLSDAILKALEKDPARRFQSANEFREALERIGAPAEPQPANEPVRAPLSPQRKLYGGAAAAAVVVAAGIGLFAVVRPGPEARPPRINIEPPGVPADAMSTVRQPVNPPAGSEPSKAEPPENQPPTAKKKDTAPDAVTAKQVELPAAPEPPRAEPQSSPGQPREVAVRAAAGVVAFSPDGRWLAVATDRNTLELWDAGSGARSAALGGHSSPITSLAFSPDGRLIATGGKDGTSKVWDLATRSERQVFGHSDPVRSIAFSSDGKWLASGTGDKRIKLWSLEDRGAVRELKERMREPQALAFSPNGQWLASVSGERSVRIWSTAEGKVRSKLDGPDHAATVAFSPDGNLLAAGGGNRVRVLDPASGDEVQSLAVDGWVQTLVFTRAGHCLAVATSAQAVVLWDVTRGIELRSLPLTEAIRGVALSLNGRRLAMVKDGGSVAILDGNPAGGPHAVERQQPILPRQPQAGFRLRSLFRKNSAERGADRN